MFLSLKYYDPSLIWMFLLYDLSYFATLEIQSV